ncbi:MAG: phosphatase PAP2 family protein, partial [Spirochaetota bacterium]
MESLFPYISYQVQWQTDTLLFFQSLQNDPLSYVFFLITSTGSESFYLAAICVIFWCISKKAGYFAGMSLIAANVLNAGLKSLFQIPRPIGHNGILSMTHPVDAIATAGGTSFPSGHSMGAGSFWFSIVTAFRKRPITILGISLMILVPLSRLYFGVHTPVDVMTGLALGILTAWGMGKIYRTAEK